MYLYEMTKNTLNSFDITSWLKWTTPLTLSLFNTQTALVAIIIFLYVRFLFSGLHEWRKRVNGRNRNEENLTPIL